MADDPVKVPDWAMDAADAVFAFSSNPAPVQVARAIVASALIVARAIDNLHGPLDRIVNILNLMDDRIAGWRRDG